MRILLILPALLLLAACQNDGLDRPGTWHATGANDANLVAMIADPADLIAGRRAPDTRGSNAAPAITRLLTDKIKQPAAVATASLGGG